MPLSTLQVNAGINWQLVKVNTGFQNTTEGPDNVTYSSSGINLTTWNQLASLQYTIASLGTQTVDLTSLTNLVGEALNFNHALSIMIKPVGSSVQVQQGAANPFAWFMNSTAVLTIPNGGCLLYADSPTGTGGTVDATHKTLLFTNNGGTSLTLNIVILGAA